MPNAPSESLEKNLFFISCANSAPFESLEKTFSFISGANSGSELLLLGTSAMAEPLARFEGFEGFALSMLNAPSESLEKKTFLSFLVQILLPLNLPRKKLFFHFLCKVWLRTPDPATAFPNLILVQNEPPLVALTEPRAHSLASARFWSVSNGQRTEPRAHSPASLGFWSVSNGQYGRTIGKVPGV